MGMCLGLCSVSDENLKRILADPPLVWRVLAPDDPEAYESARSSHVGILGRLFGQKPAPAPDLALSEGEAAHTDLDKAWQGIHYLLTGTAFEGEGPESYLLAGGAEVGDVDVGYGPARALCPAEVQEFNVAIAAIGPETLRARFNPVEMTKLGIYPDIWQRDADEDDTLGYCLEYFKVLQDFVAEAASRKHGILISLS